MKLKSRFIAIIIAAVLGVTTLQTPLPYVYAEEQNPEVIVCDTAENHEQISEREEDFPIEDTEISDTANLEIGLEETESVSENTNEDADMSSKETDETVDSETEEGQAERIDDSTESDQEIPGSLEGLEDGLVHSDSAVTATGGNIASGTYKNEQDGSDISWVIDADGKLTVEGTGNFSDSIGGDRAPWSDNRLDIKSAKVSVTGMTDASYMFYQCNAMTSVDLDDFDTSQVENMNRMFFNCLNLTALDVSNFNTSQVESMSGMFAGCRKISALDVSHFDTSKVTNMSQMFQLCENITCLDVTNFDTSNVIIMGAMFRDCKKLFSLDLSNFDTGKATNMVQMFMNCISLPQLDVSEFNTKNVTTMGSMFSGCSALEKLDLSYFNTDEVTDMGAMFSGCVNLAILNIDSFNTSKVETMSSMFSGCARLTNLNLGYCDTSSVTDILSIFRDCNSLISLDIRKLNLDKVTAQAIEILDLLYSCTNLTIIYTPVNLSKNINLPVKTGDEWYDSEGNVYTRLPLNLDHSIILSRNKIPGTSNPYLTLQKEKTTYECGETLSINDLTVTYYNSAGVSSIVNSYTTNASEIDMSTPGMKVLVVTYNDGANTLTEKLELTVIENTEPSENPVESIKLNITLLSLKVGETATLKATVTPDNASDTTITWTSSDKSVAEVENGIVTAIASGKCTITASAGDKKAVCSVNVSLSGSEDIIASGEYKDYRSDITWVIDSHGKLTVEGYGDFAVSSYISSSSYYENYKNRAPWYEYRDSILSAEINVEDMWDASFMFYGCGNMISVDLANFDTSRVSNMYGMFDGCASLKSLDLSKFNTSDLKYMDYMFSYCRNLTDLDLSGFDTSEVRTMRSVFCGCSSLASLDVSSFDTRNVSDMSWMFAECSALTELNLSGFETKRGVSQYIFEMFEGCSSLISLDLSGFDGASLMDEDPLQDMVEIFRDCDNLITIYTPHDLARGYYCLPIRAGDVWYMPDGSEITELPRSSDSMIITRNKIPTIKNSYITATLRKTEYSVGTSIETLGLIVKYYKDDGTVTIVDDYTTNADEIDMSTVGKKELIVTYNGLRAEVELMVLVIPVENIRIDKEMGNVTDKNVSTLVLESGGSADLYATVKPLNATYSEILWSSSDESVAKVMEISNNHVRVSAVASGQCTITASAGEKGVDCNVIVTTSQSKDDIAGGTFEDVRWRIDVSGKLIVEGRGDFSNSNSTNRAPWFEKRDSIKSAEINLTGATNAAYMFYGCKNITDIDVSRFDTSNVTDMTWTFRDCSSLTDLDLSSFNTGSVTRMKWMFKGCNSLKNLNVIHFDTKNVVDMGGMFDGCSSLASLDLSSFNTENVRYMNDKGGMFSGCSSLTSLDLSNFDTHNVVDMRYLFMNCKSLTKLDLSSFDTQNVTEMDSMFSGCSNLTNLDISGFNTLNVFSMSGMFSGCGLISLNLSNFDVGNVSNFAAFFEVCHELSTIYVPCNLRISVELPEGYSADSVDIWYDKDGNTYTELPQNLSHSIVLTRNQKPVISEPHITLEKGKTSYIIGEKLNTDDLKVTYYNETGIPSRVNDYTTNADEIDMSMPGKKTLVVTYRDLRAEIEITVNEKQIEETQGLKISFKNEQDRESTYTGSAIKPEIRVTYNGRLLIAGTNYTVKYANNVKAGNAKITVTGKGNFRSSKTETFRIVQADIANADFAGTDQSGRLVVASGAKFVPVIYCGGRKLTTNDYTISGTVRAGKKITESDSNQIVTLSGKGNYTGNKQITLRVVKKSDLIKFTVTLDKTKLNSLFYDGKAHYIHEISGALTVTGRDGNANMKYGRDYTIAYPANVTDAGAKKFSVIGMGIYTGTVNKSYTIKPAANTEGALKVEYESGNIENIKLPYRSTGVTFNDRLQVTYTQNGNTLTLREGRDYKITYSSNKKAGSNAKFMISFLGNYKGIKKWAGTFTIEKADLEDATVIIPDAMYKKKPGIYRSVPYVIEPETGRLIKASSYTVTYYTDQTRNMEMKGKNKVSSGDTVYVKLEAKANSNYKSDKPIVKTYQVTSAVDLSKAKLSFMSAETRTATKSAEYTGQKITDREITVLVNGKPADADMIVTYANNVDKGKATVIVMGTGEPGCKYTGCKKATFNIVAYKLR